jgi:3-deoxy-D-manno-oct-2-ulosonic acid (Kdo) hydroxylase
MQAIEMIFGQGGPEDAHDVLERGDIVMFRETPFEMPAEERDFILGVRLNPEFHKNIAYKPNADRISGVAKLESDAVERLHSILRSYSRRTTDFAAKVLPRYAQRWKSDYASLRPVEEQGRELPLKKRNDLLHTDAFPTRPTNGDLILRIFTNVNPAKSRVWITSDPFEKLAQRYALSAGLKDVARPDPLFGVRRALHSIGLPVIARPPYDRFMLGFHDYLKMNEEYQRDCPKYRFEFPPGATWMVFTDVVPHSVESGQFAMEQTMIVAHDSLAQPSRAPIAILEKLAGRSLAA